MRYFSLLRPVLHALPPETVHRLGIHTLALGLVPPAPPLDAPILRTRVFGLDFATPVGLAAGFDKNAEAVIPLLRQGFGFVEAGTVTPRAQAGNPQPRLFRLTEDHAVINRLGFNNEGLAPFVVRLAAASARPGIVGANIGRNKDSADAIADYVTCLEQVYPYCDYVTVNISSPNTPGLRDLQEKTALFELMQTLVRTRDSLAERLKIRRPVLVKLAPDLDEAALEGIAEVLIGQAVDGILLTNTTISRPDGLRSPHRGEQGGLSGAPLFAPSTTALRRMHRIIGGRIPLIGVGGVFTAEDAYAKIRAGASLVQLYTALVYEGFGVVRTISEGLAALLEREGFKSVAEAVGTEAR